MSNDLSDDPFLNCAVLDLSCNLYYRFGAWLSHLSAGIIIGRHYIKNKPHVDEEITQSDEK